MIFREVALKAQQIVAENAPAILTGVAVFGTVSTAYLTGKASVKAMRILDEEAEEHPEIETKEKILLVWKEYAAPVGMGVITVSAILLANRINSKRLAAAVAAYSLSERRFSEYAEKAKEKLGKNKENALQDELAQDRVNQHPVGNQTIIITGGGDVLCYDNYTGRYFQSSMETIRKAENDINRQIINDNYASLNDFYSFVGLPQTKVGSEVGWNLDKGLELRVTTTMSEDQRPCLEVDFQTTPILGYYRVH